MRKVTAILLVDDDDTTNTINEMLIEELNVTELLYQTSNGREALNLLAELISHNKPLPELILLDINMPVMDGFEFLEEYFNLNFTGKPPVVIMLTTSLNPSDVRRVESFGVADYLNKPLLEKSLLNILAKYVV